MSQQSSSGTKVFNMAMGQNPVPVNIPIPTQTESKMGGAFTYQPKWDSKTVLTTAILWMDEILHQLEAMGKTKSVGIYKGIMIPGFLRWCEMDFVQPQSYQPWKIGRPEALP